MTAPVSLREARTTYGHGDNTVTALNGVTVDFPAGSVTAAMEPSRSGKSTLPHCAAGPVTVICARQAMRVPPIEGLKLA